MNASSAFLTSSVIYSTALARFLEEERIAKSVCDSLEKREVPADAADAMILRNRITFAVENYAKKRQKTTNFINAHSRTAGAAA